MRVFGPRKRVGDGKSRHTEEQIIRVLPQVEVGQRVKDVIRQHGISEQTYYRWKPKSGGLQVFEARCLKELEIENRRPKKLMADLSLRHQILKDALSRKW